jgi:hypothetical protein
MLVNAKPVDSYSYKFGGMLGNDTYMQIGYESNPSMQGKLNTVEPVRRRLLYVTHKPRENMQVFGRYLSEEQTLQKTGQSTYTFGVGGQLSEHSRLQFQVDAATRRAADGTTQSGAAYALEFERNMSDDDSLVLKYRLQPKAFTAEKDEVQIEAGYKLAF